MNSADTPRLGSIEFLAKARRPTFNSAYTLVSVRLPVILLKVVFNYTAKEADLNLT